MNSKVQIEDLLLLSPVQQSLLAEIIVSGHYGSHLAQKAYRWRGAIDVAVLSKSMDALTRRTPLLRASVHWQALEKPLITVQGELPQPLLSLQDWKGMSTDQQAAEFADLSRAEREHEFRLDQAPLVRCCAVELGLDEHLLLWTFHRMVLDPQSVNALTGTLCEIYENLEKKDEVDSITGAPTGFKEYVSWINVQDVTPFQNFWHASLQTLRTDDGFDFIAGDSSPAANLQRAELQIRDLPVTEKNHIRALLHGAWALLLHQITGREAIIFDTNVSGRGNNNNAKQIAGPFEYLAPFSCSVRANTSVQTWLENLQGQWNDVERFSGFGGDRIADWGEVPKRRILCDTALLVSCLPVEIAFPTKTGPVAVREMSLPGQAFGHVLTLSVQPEQGLQLELLYYSSQFDSHSIECLLARFGRLLQQLARDSAQPVNALEMSSAAERRQLDEWSEGPRISFETKCIHELIEAQTARVPENTAAVFENESLAYRELNAQANQLARHLEHMGVGPETVVGVLMSRCLKTPVALLAILKAKGVYFPIDPELPKERITFLLQDARPAVLLIQQEFLFDLPPIAAASEVFCIDADWDQITSYSKEDKRSSHDPDALAYIIYTSGSTGNPKGVAVPHSAAVFHLAGIQKEFRYCETDRALQFASLSFDVSIEQILAPLCHGAAVVLKDNVSWGKAEFFQALEDLRITVANVPPAYWAQLVDGNLVAAPASLRLMIIGGDVMPVETLRRWQQTSLENRELLNAYGPTESVITATIFHLPAKFSETRELRRVPIGRPLAGRKAYVVNSVGHLSPVGMWGELFLGGQGLARGYLNHPELTAEKFVPDSFGGRGERLYRTGDLARFTADGVLEFLGRTDGQIKIRGYRIEAGEIEVALLSQDSVEQAAVVAREDRPGEKYLVGYVQLRTGAELTGSQLQDYLKDRIPAYMVPTIIMVLDRLPLTSSGKIDRKSLPQPEASGDQQNYAAPRTPTETMLCELWAKLLGLERVGIHDNFFELGGDSILSIQMTGRAREAGVEFAPNLIFERQTVAELAEVAGVTSIQEEHEEQDSSPIPLTPIQMAFFDWRLARPDHFNQSIWLELRDDVDSVLLERALAVLLSHHDALRTRYKEGLDTWLQSCPNEVPSDFYERHDLTNLPGPAQSQSLRTHSLEAQTSLSIGTGRLLKAAEYDLGTTRGRRLLLVIHHLAVDGVSWRILLEDLERVYQQLKNGELGAPAGARGSFARWARVLQQFSSSEAEASEIDYWTADCRKTVTRVAPDVVQAQPGQNLVAMQQTVEVALSEEETQQLLQRVPAAYHTQINDALLTALAKTLASVDGCQGVLVDVESHGREAPVPTVEISRTVGWFTSIYPIVLNIDRSWPTKQAMTSIKEQIRQVPNRGTNYGILRFLSNDITVRSRLAQMPQAEICFNYLGQFDQTLKDSLLFSSATENSLGTEAGENQRRYVLEIDSLVLDGRLRVRWIYGEQLHQQQTVKALADRYLEFLREIIRHCQSEKAGTYTPSDFALANLKQAELERWFGQQTDVEDIYPLAPMQQGLLFHSVYAPEARPYFNQLSCHIQGTLDLASFRKAWEAVIQRHAILRTEFSWEAQREPLQIVRKAAVLPWSEEDWTGLPQADQEERWEELLHNDRERGFDFSRAPLTRITVRRLGIDEYYFAWSDHHILMDGWSHQIVLGDMFAIYHAFLQGKQPELPPVRSYREYIAWLCGQDEEQAEIFWRGELEGFTTPTILCIDKSQGKAEVLDEHFVEHGVMLAPQFMGALEQLAQHQHVTLNIVLQSAWAILLSRYSGERDVVFGSVSGRSSAMPGIEEIPGLFINTLPVRAQIVPEAPLASLFKELQKQQGRLRQYEYSALMKVQEWSEVPSGTPLFDYIMAFENYPLDDSLRSYAGVNLKVDKIRTFDVPHYPLTLRMTPVPEPYLELIYKQGRFEAEDIRLLLEHLHTLLQAMVAHPELQTRDLSLLSDREQSQVLEEFNRTAAEYPKEACLHRLFEEQVKRTPEEIALICGIERLTFAELNQKANQLAHYLRRLGVRTEDRVGIHLERSAEMVTGVLAVLKTGAAYVPLDLDYPDERLAFLIQDSAASVILAGKSQQQFPQTNAHWVFLDGVAGQISHESRENPLNAATPETLAYLIYTSGSTGRPKGVMVPHRGVVNYLHWAVHRYRGEGTGSVVHTPLGFDLTVTSLYVPLLSGQCVELVPERGVGGVEGLQSLLKHGKQRSLMKVTPAHLGVMEQLLDPQGAQSSAGIMVIGGEALDWQQLQFWLHHAPATRLINEYGPTETVVGCCVYEVANRQTAGAVPIGLPINNTKIYVLDEELRPQAIGIRGEIYISGVGVGRGYWNMPGLTAERFVADPYSGECGTRMYKTGDYGRWTASGVLEYLGRNDDQVKLRGYRIELGEIESVLRQAPNIRGAVVLKKNLPAGPGLVAYVVPKRPQTLDRQALKAFVAEKLPIYLVPEIIVALDRIPYTTNGKVNRKALPEPGEYVTGEQKPFGGAKTPTQEIVAAIWAEALGHEKIGIHDNFFELGGQSMVAVRIMSRVRTALNVEVTPTLLFEANTVAKLSERIEGLLQKDVSMPAPLTAASRSGRIPLSYSQERMWFFDQFSPGSALYNIVQGIRIHGELNLRALEQSVNEIFRRHEVFRAVFPAFRGEPYQEIAPATLHKIEVLDLSGQEKNVQERRIRQIIEHEERTAFDLSRGPLARLRLCSLGEHEYILLFALHHIIFDAWSANVLMHELEILYDAFSRDLPSPLAHLPVQYSDYAQWEKTIMERERFKQDLEFWKRHLRSPLPVLCLKTDRPRPEVQTFRGAKHDVKIPRKLAEQLTKISRQEDSTLFMLLLSAFNVLLSYESGQTDIVVGTDVANRPNLETERLIGLFVNQIPLRTSVTWSDEFLDLLKRVKQTAVETYAHQQVPFDRLITELRMQRSAQSTPIFQVKLVLVNTPPTTFKLTQLEVEPMEFTTAPAKVDFALVLVELPGSLEGWIEYNSDLFYQSTVARLAEEYLAILARVTLDPHVCLQEIRADLSPDFPQERGPKDDSLSIGAALS